MSCRKNILFFWLKTKFMLTNSNIQIKSPNTLFGILPIGQREETINLRSISSVQKSSKIHIIRLILGFWIFTGSFRVIQGPQFFALGMSMLIVGAVLLLFSYKYTLKIRNHSGHTITVEVPFSESSKINAISRKLIIKLQPFSYLTND